MKTKLGNFVGRRRRNSNCLDLRNILKILRIYVIIFQLLFGGGSGSGGGGGGGVLAAGFNQESCI